ncbi:MAG: hypothetical protein ACRD47_07665 [Nitrososphaeraceae archaeon]
MDKRNIEIDITGDHKELNEWVEIIGKTANEICNDPDCNRMNEQHTGFIVESNDAGALGLSRLGYRTTSRCYST